MGTEPTRSRPRASSCSTWRRPRSRSWTGRATPRSARWARCRSRRTRPTSFPVASRRGGRARRRDRIDGDDRHQCARVARPTRTRARRRDSLRATPFDVAPTPMSDRPRRRGARGGRRSGTDSDRPPLRAAHDAMRVAEVTDSSLLFAPSRDGISHSPRASGRTGATAPRRRRFSRARWRG